jgi:hypothetical protein
MVRVGVEWVNKFPEPCSATGLSYCDDTAVGFLKAMKFDELVYHQINLVFKFM